MTGRRVKNELLAVQAFRYKRRQNLYSPISRLSHELLAEIFLLCRDISAPSTFKFWPHVVYSRVDSAHAWIAVIQVCHRWRNVALRTPELWNKIFVDSPKWLPHLLFYSRDSPLSLFLGPTAATVVNAHALPINRACRLSVCVEADKRRETRLESTSVTDLTMYNAVPQGEIWAPPFSFPNLTSLTMVNVLPLWPNPLYSTNLTRVHITYPIAAGSPLYHKVISALSSLPVLHTLAFHVRTPTQRDRAIPPLLRPSLPKLTHLSLAGPLTFLEYSLKTLLYPADTRINLIGTVLNGTDARRVYISLGHQYWHRLRMTNSLKIQAWGVNAHLQFLTDHNPASCSTIAPWLSVLLTTPKASDPFLIWPVFDHIPTTQLRKLDLTWAMPNEFPSLIKNKFRQIFHSLPRLSVLSLGRHAVGELLDILGESVPHTPSATDDTRATDVLLPELDSLTLKYAWCRSSRTDRMNDAFIEECEWVLGRRQRQQRRLLLLRLETMVNMGSTDVDLLQGYVERVEWDGLEVWVDSSDPDPYPFRLQHGQALGRRWF